MARYGAKGGQALTAAWISALGITSDATTPHRCHVYHVIVGNEGTPDDYVVQYRVQRCTTIGTGTTVTAVAVDPGDRAAQAAVRENHTAEPTYTAAGVLLEVPVNARGTWQWIAPPGGELVVPATANNGVGIRGKAASQTTDFTVNAFWSE